MLALQVDERGIDREELIRAIYQAAAEMKATLTEDHLLLLDQWVDAYNRIPEPRLEHIKQEIGMEFVATTISEHIFHEGLLEGEAKGEAKGKINGQISMLETLHQFGLVSDEQFQHMIGPLRRKLTELSNNTASPHV